MSLWCYIIHSIIESLFTKGPGFLTILHVLTSRDRGIICTTVLFLLCWSLFYRYEWGLHIVLHHRHICGPIHAQQAVKKLLLRNLPWCHWKVHLDMCRGFSIDILLFNKILYENMKELHSKIELKFVVRIKGYCGWTTELSINHRFFLC